MSDLVNYSRTPDYVPDAVPLTVRETVKISGKSIQTMHRALPLLKLFYEIQAALREGKLPVSQRI
jgi:hypothetical protein